MTTVTLEILHEVIERALLRAGLAPEDATACARVHAESTRDGVNSHGLGRKQ
ncbi:hypothetical protein [Kushneria indalinina]|uniref:Malate/lactate dehydrogenase-like protein n=1 Tax=Kushneria indalinina DSM 14324 TaxID=1122140 RepID=A0A3D9E0N8_9GAMM|nr:hypothetical protein [Kushneria indalinina]REC96465.1 malate/lactate dehydrogenase-like protein [Kushneria indalinina DSM 14324]